MVDLIPPYSSMTFASAVGTSSPEPNRTTYATRIGDLSFTHDFENGYPTYETVDKLFNELDFQRACQVYLWAIPLVAFAQWQYAHENTFGAKSGDIVYYANYAAKLGLLTANATTPYALSFINLAETGPIVIVVPEAEVRGATHSMWQVQITSMVEPGKYVFHAPGTEAPSVDNSYSVFEASTNSIFFGIRLMAPDRETQEEALQQIQIYPLADQDAPGETQVIEADDRPWQGWQPRGLDYFVRLADILGREPVDERDRFFHAMLQPLGIQKGKPFELGKLTYQQKTILIQAAWIGEAMAKANDFFNPRLEQSHYYEGSHWEIATVCPPSQRWEEADRNYEALDGRAAWFYEAVTNDDAMQSQEAGKDQIYLAAYHDRDGDWLDGANSYRLHVPQEPTPAEEFWSTTVYDVSTRCLIDNEQQIADKSSRMPDLIVNADNSVDIYFGPEAPVGKEQNWIPTVPGRAWFIYFRLYSPTQAYFDRTWVVPDIEKASW